MTSLQVWKRAAGTLVGTTLLACSINSATAATGAEIYGQRCLACHGVTGAGDGPHTSTLATPPASFIGKAIKLGVERALMTGVTDIPGHGVGPLFTPREVENLIEYIDALSTGQTGDVQPAIEIQIPDSETN